MSHQLQCPGCKAWSPPLELTPGGQWTCPYCAKGWVEGTMQPRRGELVALPGGGQRAPQAATAIPPGVHMGALQPADVEHVLAQITVLLRSGTVGAVALCVFGADQLAVLSRTYFGPVPMPLLYLMGGMLQSDAMRTMTGTPIPVLPTTIPPRSS